MFDTNQSSFRQLGDIVSETVRPLVAWIGAGLSRPAGLPSWAALRQRLTEALDEKAKALETSAKDSLAGKLRAVRGQESSWIA